MGFIIRAVVVIGLAIDAYVHFHLASDFKNNNDGLISGDWMFRLEGLAAAVIAVLVLIWANRFTYLLAFLIAALGVAAVVLFSKYNLGRIWPMSTIYDPIWSTEKWVSLWGEAAAAVAAFIGMFLTPAGRRISGRERVPVR